MSGPPPAPPGAFDQRGLPRGWNWQPEWEVTPRDVLQGLRSAADDAPLLIDCRRDDEWALCRIEGAVLIPLHDLPNQRERLEDLLGERPRPVHIYCHHGRRSLQAAAILRQMGFAGAKSMAGGIDLWSQTIDPSVPRY